MALRIPDSITTKDILNARNEAQQLWLADRRGFEKLEEQQEREEFEIVEAGIACPITTEIATEVPESEVLPLLREDFFDASAYSKLLCNMQAIFYTPKTNMLSVSNWIQKAQDGATLGAKLDTEAVRDTLSRPKIIGKPSADGIAAVVDFGSNEKAFILKAPRDSRNAELLTHELVVGLQLNKLRAWVPNFAYVFGGFKCSAPRLRDKTVTSWCQYTGNGVRYVLYENITPGKDFRDFCKTCTFTDYVGLYIQVLLAVQFAADKTGFTHNDLHDENIFVRDYPKKVYIPYETPNGTVYIHTDKIATLIDYGRSTIARDGRSYGNYMQLELGDSTPLRPFPFNDAYKLLCFSLLTLQKYNVDVFVKARGILEFFNRPESAVEILAKQRETYYVLPPTLKRLDELTLYDLVDYISDKFSYLRLLVSEKEKEADGTVYNCYAPPSPEENAAVCVTTTPAGPLTTLDYARPRTLSELYTLLPHLSDAQVNNWIEALRKDERTPTLLDANAAIVERSLERLLEKHDSDLPVDALTNYESFFRGLDSAAEATVHSGIDNYVALVSNILVAIQHLQTTHYIAEVNDYFSSKLGHSATLSSMVHTHYRDVWQDDLQMLRKTLQSALIAVRSLMKHRTGDLWQHLDAQDYFLGVALDVVNAFLGSEKKEGKKAAKKATKKSKLSRSKLEKLKLAELRDLAKQKPHGLSDTEFNGLKKKELIDLLLNRA